MDNKPDKNDMMGLAELGMTDLLGNDMAGFEKVNDRIFVHKASYNPLSADVYLIKGDSFNWIFDVGASAEVLEILKEIKNRRIVISHFHRDHIGNLGELPMLEENEALYVSNHSSKYCKANMEGFTVVDSQIEFDDGVHIAIKPFKSSHSKGCLMMSVNSEYFFWGDGTYALPKQNQPQVYNVQLLKETIEDLEENGAAEFVLSHDRIFSRPREAILRQLRTVYAGRKQGENFIEVSEDFD